MAAPLRSISDGFRSLLAELACREAAHRLLCCFNISEARRPESAQLLAKRSRHAFGYLMLYSIDKLLD